MQFIFDDFRLDTDRRELYRGPTPVPVEPQVFDLLVCLLQNRDRVVSRDDLIASVWGGRIVSDSAVASRINAARRALGDSGGSQRLIRTIVRRGVRFVGAVEVRPDGGDARPPPRAATPRTDRPAIAVLPFVNASAEPEQDYFADGISEDIITALARLRWLFVIARNSSFAYRTEAVPLRRIGEELGVGYLVEGSVRTSGERVRITAQLNDVAAGSQLWAERYDPASPTSSRCRTRSPRRSSRRSSRRSMRRKIFVPDARRRRASTPGASSCARCRTSGG